MSFADFDCHTFMSWGTNAAVVSDPATKPKISIGLKEFMKLMQMVWLIPLLPYKWSLKYSQ